MSVSTLIVLWSWNIADSCDSLKSSWETLILWILIIIVQNIILLWAISYCRSCSLIQQHSVFMRRKQLSITHCFYCIVRAHLSEHDQMSQLWEHISNWDQNAWISASLWIIFLSYWTHIHIWYLIEISWFSSSSSQEIIQSSRSVVWIINKNLQIQEMLIYCEHFMSFFNL